MGRDFKIGNYQSYNGAMTVFQHLSNIYMATLDKKDLQPVKVPKELLDYTKTLYRGLGGEESLVTEHGSITPCNYPRDEDLTIFLYTGGKDSLASYMKYRGGKKDKAIFIKGLNPLYPKEHELLEHHAEKLKMDLSITTLKAPRLKNQPESSVKNLLSYVIAIDYFKTIPGKMSFGFINPNLGITEELEDLEEEHLLAIKREMLLSEEVEGSLQTSEVAGDSKEVSVQAVLFLERFYGIGLTSGVKSLAETYKLVKKSGLIHHLTSCMSLTTFKEYNKKKSIEKYGIEVEGEKYLGATLRYRDKKRVSHIPLDEFYIKQKHGEFYNYDLKRYEKPSRMKKGYMWRVAEPGSYNCTTCFKCCEHYIALYNFLGYKYNREFILSRYALLLKNLEKSVNENGVDFSQWLNYDLWVTQDLLDELKEGRYITGKVYEEVMKCL